MSFADLVIWNMPELWSERGRRKGIPDLFLFYLDHAEKKQNIEYLERVAAGLQVDIEDPYGRLAAEAKEILKRLLIE